MDVQYRFDDEVKDDAHGAFTPHSLDHKLVETLVRAHTNLTLRESLDDVLRHLLPWDIELVIDEPVDEQEEEPEVEVRIVVTQTYLICRESRRAYAPIVCIQHLF